jgi:hypothetical protein
MKRAKAWVIATVITVLVLSCAAGVIKGRAAITKLLADTAWMVVSVAACCRWLNSNQGVWGFALGFAGLIVSAAISIYFRRATLDAVRAAGARGGMPAAAKKMVEEDD